MNPSIHANGTARQGNPTDEAIREAISKGYSRRTTPLPPTPPDPPGPTPPPEPPPDKPEWPFCPRMRLGVKFTVNGRPIGKVQIEPFVDL